MYEENFPIRLAQLRNKKRVSARDMSLSIGQNEGYINNIESGKAFPSMSAFFFICEYLNISPKDFFDFESKNPEKLNSLIDDLVKLSDDELAAVSVIVKSMIKG